MITRRVTILIAVLIFTSVACTCGTLNQIINRLPFVGNNTSQMEKTLEALPFPQLATEIVTPSESGNSGVELGDVEDLSTINAYQAELTISFEGIDQNSNIVNESVVRFQEVVRNQEAIHLISTSKSNGELLPQNFEFYEIGETSYLINTDGTAVANRCTLLSSGSDIDRSLYSSKMVLPDSIFQNIEKGNLLESNVKINGVVTDHYQVNNATLNGSVLTITKGEVWIAHQGNFVVRFSAEGDGETSSILNGNAITGKTIWNYELLSINQLEAIELPRECLDAAANSVTGIPIPGDAISKATFGSLTTFNSPQTTLEISAYYQEILPTLGFTAKDISQLDSMAVLVYTKDEITYSIIISPGDNEESTVIISFE